MSGARSFSISYYNRADESLSGCCQRHLCCFFQHLMSWSPESSRVNFPKFHTTTFSPVFSWLAVQTTNGMDTSQTDAAHNAVDFARANNKQANLQERSTDILIIYKIAPPNDFGISVYSRRKWYMEWVQELFHATPRNNRWNRSINNCSDQMVETTAVFISTL